jgi:hypothetical protein
MVTAAALLLVAVLSLLGLALLDISFRDIQVSNNMRDSARALYAAEAGVESAYQQIKVATGLKANPGLNTDGSITITPPSGYSDYTFTTLTAVPLYLNGAVPPAPTTQTQTIGAGTYAGLNSFAQNYLVTSEVSGPNGSRAKLVQVFQSGFAPLFQFAVFYDEILEIFPGQPFTIVGRTHSNKHVHIGNDTTNVDSFLTSAQNIYRYRLDTGATPAGANIKNAAGVYQDFAKDHNAADWTTWAINTYNGRVRDSAHSAPSLTLPGAGLISDSHDIIEKGVGPGPGEDSPALQQEKMYWKADYRILVDSGGTVTVKTGPFGSETTVGLDTSPFLTTTKEFVDKRENKCQDVAEINVDALRTAPGWSFSKGILYVSTAKAKGPATSCNGSGSWNHTAAVRLTNGTQLPIPTGAGAKGFTVATDRPIYVQGDYNTKYWNGSSWALHNGSDVTTPPAAVMADAVTVLSNNWGPNNSDAKGNNAVTDRNATSTTAYAGMISGIVPTVPGGGSNFYSGGLENYFRLLENWSGDTLTYRGSMVMLYDSEVATGRWQPTGNYYNAPTRDWAFDTLFKENPPPGTPTLHITQRVGWWHQE